MSRHEANETLCKHIKLNIKPSRRRWNFGRKNKLFTLIPRVKLISASKWNKTLIIEARRNKNLFVFNN